MDNVKNVVTGRASGGSAVLGAIVIIFVLIALIYVMIYLVRDWRYAGESSPWIVEGTRIARKGLRLPGALIPPSNDQQYGIEFSYSLWIYVNSWDTPNTLVGHPTGPLKHILHKGSSNMAYPNFQAPGIWMDQGNNKIVVKMNTYDNMHEECIVDNIPIGKWVYLTVVVINNNVDIYINANLKNRCQLNGVPMLNVGDIFVTQNGGFDGFVSNIKYFAKALPYWKIEQLFNMGPAQTPCTETGVAPPPDYLSRNYWLSGSAGQRGL